MNNVTCYLCNILAIVSRQWWHYWDQHPPNGRCRRMHWWDLQIIQSWSAWNNLRSWLPNNRWRSVRDLCHWQNGTGTKMGTNEWTCMGRVAFVNKISYQLEHGDRRHFQPLLLDGLFIQFVFVFVFFVLFVLFLLLFRLLFTFFRIHHWFIHFFFVKIWTETSHYRLKLLLFCP